MRGYLERLFCSEELARVGWNRPVAQVNHTFTARKGTVRGMHFQYPPYGEMKLVWCLRGRIFDVAVDLRAGSSTFLQWHGEELSEDNDRGLLVPEGFAHGFQTLTDDAEILYFNSRPYHPASEAGVHPNDPKTAIRWPIPISAMSARDSVHPWIEDGFKGIQGG